MGRNNLGAFGSPSYYSSNSHLNSSVLLKKQDLFNHDLYTLSGFKPFTNIMYVNASRKEQVFSIKHLQSFGELLEFDFKFKKINSPGAFLNQETNNTIFNRNVKYGFSWV